MKIRLRVTFVLLALLTFTTAIVEAAEFPNRVGRILRLQGEVVELPEGFGSRPLRIGAAVHARSKIKTGPDARLEIEFIDGSRMTLGEWAFVTLDFRLKDYRPAPAPGEQPETPTPRNQSNSMTVNILAGTFRFVTGLIARINNRNVRFGTQVATIGVRGTDFFGGPLAAGMPPGEIHYGFMVLDGAIDVGNALGSVTLDSPREGTFLPMRGNRAPTPPNTWRKPAIDEAFASLAFR